MDSSQHNKILNVTLTSIFSALTFAVMFLPKIYLPALVGAPYIHFGNLIVIIVSLLFGGLIGGISGAIGMGLYDIIFGYGIWTIKTIVLKLLLGLVVGFVYKRNKSITNEARITRKSITSGILATILGLMLMIIDFELKIEEIEWYLYIFIILLGLMVLINSIIVVKRDGDSKAAFYACTIGIAFNVCGELIGKIIKALLEGNDFYISTLISVASIPATVINGVISFIAVLLTYRLLKNASKKLV